MPDFTALYTAIKFKNWLPPEIPIMYLSESESTLRTTRFAEERPFGSAGNQPIAAVGETKATSQGDERSTISKSIKNGDVPVSIRSLSGNIGKIQKFLEIMGDGTPPQIPKNNKGHEMCLSWYIKGSCYSTCQRKTSHEKLTPPEEKRLVEFLKKGIAKQQAAQAGTTANVAE